MLAVYNYDWRKLRKTTHITQSRERSNRYLFRVKDKDYILFATYEVRRRRAYLHMSGDYILVVQLKNERKKDLIITIIPKLPTSPQWYEQRNMGNWTNYPIIVIDDRERGTNYGN